MINKEIKMHLACGNDDLRPVMQYIKVNRDVCVATNAHIMAIVPTTQMFSDEFISHIPDGGVLIHKEDWKKMLGFEYATWKTNGEVIALVSEKKRNTLIEAELEKNVNTFPNWQSVIPNVEERTAELNTIGINFSLAFDLQRALGITECRLQFASHNKAIYVSSRDIANKAYGVLMPVILNH